MSSQPTVDPTAPTYIRYRPAYQTGCAIGLIGVLGIVGLLSFVVALKAWTDDDYSDMAATVGVVVGVVSTCCTAPPIFWLIFGKRSRQLTIDGWRLRYHQPRRPPVAIEWSELRGVRHASTPSGAKDPSTHYLELVPADPGFRARHPEMESWWWPTDGLPCYRLSVGQPWNANKAVAAIRQHAPDWYLGEHTVLF